MGEFLGMNTGTAISAGAGLGMDILGMIGQKSRERRAMKNQKELMFQQLANQRNLNEQGSQLQYEMWKKTNYPAQMQMLREAGLNPGLLYGMSGGGATTTGSQGGGSAQGGSAPAIQPMELGSMMQNASVASQIKLNEALAEQAEANARRTSGSQTELDKANIASLTQGIKNQKAQKLMTEAQTAMQNIQNKIVGETMEDAMDTITYTAEKARADARTASYIEDWNKETLQNRIDIINKEAIYQGIKNELTRTQIDFTDQQILKLANDIIIDTEKLGLDLEDTITKRYSSKTERMNLEQRKSELIFRYTELEMNAKLKEIGLSIEEQKAIGDLVGNLLGGRTRTTTSTKKTGPGWEETTTKHN